MEKRNYITNIDPLATVDFDELPFGSIKPAGWLKRQLEIQAEGLTGNLDKIWESVNSNSAWLGGTGENWERGPYYCDGLVPLAYLLENQELIEKANKWIEWSFDSQKKDGSFGPQSNNDWWPRMVMLKAIISYYEFTGDQRAISFLLKYFSYQKKYLPLKPLTDWGKARAGENIYAILWLYNRTKENYLLDLCDILSEQSLNWTKFFLNFPYIMPIKFYFDTHYADEILKNANENEKKIWEMARQASNYHFHHVVNVAMGIKTPGLLYQIYKDKIYIDAIRSGIDSLMKYHGVASGMFTGDEHLSGNNPSQGTELCAVVEYLFSLETLLKIFPDNTYLSDLIEKIAYNALPAPFTKDMCAHQYDQQVNQVIVSVAKRNWYDNADDSNIFGLEPNFGCCTANMHQGWPKFLKTLWLATNDKGLACFVYAPCKIDAKVCQNSHVKINVDTDYPFNDKITIKIFTQKDVKFPLKLKVPGWSTNLNISINGKFYRTYNDGNVKFCEINRIWKNNDTVILKIPFNIKTREWINRSVSVEYGPLVYSLKIKERWKKLKERGRFSDWEIYPGSAWNYAIVFDCKNKLKNFKIKKGKISPYIFDSSKSPVTIELTGKKVSKWKIENNSAGELPLSPLKLKTKNTTIKLIPYASAKLRITQFPWTV